MNEKMQCFKDLFNNGELCAGNRLSHEDYDSLMSSMQLMMNVTPASILGDITPAELKLIYRAAYHFEHTGEPITVVEAADRMGISAPAVSRTLRGLDTKGYLKRQMDENDRRCIRILVTESGMEILRDGMSKCLAVMNRVFAEFTDKELAQIVKLHCKMTKALTKVIAEQK